MSSFTCAHPYTATVRSPGLHTHSSLRVSKNCQSCSVLLPVDFIFILLFEGQECSLGLSLLWGFGRKFLNSEGPYGGLIPSTAFSGPMLRIRRKSVWVRMLGSVLHLMGWKTPRRGFGGAFHLGISLQDDARRSNEVDTRQPIRELSETAVFLLSVKCLAASKAKMQACLSFAEFSYSSLLWTLATPQPGTQVPWDDT